MKHTKLFLSLLILAGVLLSACGGGAAPAPAATAVAPAATEAAPAAGQPFSCTDKLGCVDIGPSDPIHIAYLFVTSGDNSTLGLDTKYGAELAAAKREGNLQGTR